MSSCNILRGSDGAQFPPGVGQEDLWMFNTLPCRSLSLEYKGRADVQDIPVLQFGFPADLANINKSSNVCSCRELSEAVTELLEGRDSCVRGTDGDTLDTTHCNTTDWLCYDGILDVHNVIIRLEQNNVR